jgi:hypothetical protein
MNEKYLIHWGKELGWALLVGIVAYVAAQLAAADLDTLDVQAFAMSRVVGSGRLALAILLNQVRTLFGSP